MATKLHDLHIMTVAFTDRLRAMGVASRSARCESFPAGRRIKAHRVGY